GPQRIAPEKRLESVRRVRLPPPGLRPWVQPTLPDRDLRPEQTRPVRRDSWPPGLRAAVEAVAAWRDPKWGSARRRRAPSFPPAARTDRPASRQSARGCAAGRWGAGPAPARPAWSDGLPSLPRRSGPPALLAR